MFFFIYLFAPEPNFHFQAYRNAFRIEKSILEIWRKTFFMAWVCRTEFVYDMPEEHGEERMCM